MPSAHARAQLNKYSRSLNTTSPERVLLTAKALQLSNNGSVRHPDKIDIHGLARRSSQVAIRSLGLLKGSAISVLVRQSSEHGTLPGLGLTEKRTSKRIRTNKLTFAVKSGADDYRLCLLGRFRGRRIISFLQLFIWEPKSNKATRDFPI